MAAEDTAQEIEQLLDELQNQGIETDVEWLETDQEHEQGHISREKNFYQGMLNGSFGEITYDGPRLIVYSHSPGFQKGDQGLAKVRGPDPSKSRYVTHKGERVKQSQNVETGFIPLEVETEELLPPSNYDDVEVVLEHDKIEMVEDYPVSFQVLPRDFFEVGTSVEDAIENYRRNN